MRQLLMACFLIPIIASGQSETIEPISFSEVITVDSSLKKNELYSRLKTWFAEAFKSSQDVIQLDDRESGKIY